MFEVSDIIESVSIEVNTRFFFFFFFFNSTSSIDNFEPRYRVVKIPRCRNAGKHS